MNTNNEKNSSENTGTVKRSRKEIVKTLIIVFLLIMLILTFFSNTIMNRSLAEVSVTRLGRETIKRSLPVELIIEANQTYSVSAEEARDIKRVAVKKGDEVKEGQVIFYLKDMAESEAVKALQDEIDLEKLAYEKSLLKKAPDYYELNAAIQSARDDLNDAISKKNNAASAPSVPSVPDNGDEIAALKALELRLESDKACLAEENYSSLSSESFSAISSEYSAYTEAQKNYDTAKSEFDSLGEDRSSELTKMKRDLDTLKTSLRRLEEDNASARDIEDKKTEIKYLEEDIAEIETQSSQIAEKKKTLSDKSKELDSAGSALSTVVRKLEISVASELSETISRLEALQTSADYSEHDFIPGESEIDYDTLIREKQYILDSAVHSLEEKISADKLLDTESNLDMTAAKKKIEEKEKKLEEMLSKQTETEIKSPVDGIVEEIKVRAGQAFEVNDELLVLNISEEGFTAEYSVDSDKVKRISKGQKFDITENKEDIDVVLSDMKKDKNDQKKTILKFSVSGSDSVAGKKITVDIGDEPAPMENVIPKNAVKEDSKGKFVYAVRSKSSPLGNRYIVTRVDVSVISSDDTKAAVSGEFGDSGDFIITASSKPFSSGDQVRLAED